MIIRIIEKLKILKVFPTKYWLLIFFISTITYLELVYRLWNFKSIGLDFIFPGLFALTAGAVLFVITGIFPDTINMVLSLFLTLLLVICYGIQLVYYSIFKTPFSFYSLTGAGEAMQFQDIISSAILKNTFAIILLFVPLLLLFVVGSKLPFLRIKPLQGGIIMLLCITSFMISIACVNLTGKGATSQYTLYYNIISPDLSVRKLGLLTTMRLDIEGYVFGFDRNDDTEEAYVDNNDEKDGPSDTGEVTPSATGSTPSSEPTPEPSATAPVEGYNTINIDFDSLIVKEKNGTLAEMHKYFSSVKPTKKNQYTGMFKGDNLILITAEGFSRFAVNPAYTPTLYKIANEGFVFNNFYNPIWGVSTSDGEYVACTGLIPKAGVWSFKKSGKNYLPFVMGKQLGKLGYTTKAYHDHSFTYYGRDVSHPNMGYEFKAVGNGLKVQNTWPESDLEMINATAGEYIGSKPFHTYYMTVSGHMNYSFGGNFIARKNKDLVSSLPYSESSKAYIACNMELEFAMKALIEKLEAAGVADKTVIAISPDHYPYGLPRECIDELAGHKVEDNFELYKSTLIIWKKGMEPVTIDKPCSSLDILPTLSNLLGLDYDSRLVMGTDILSDTSPTVIFSNRSWITGRAMYNSITNTAVFNDGTKSDPGYVNGINKTVSDKFKYSAKILETDYYRKIVANDQVKN